MTTEGLKFGLWTDSRLSGDVRRRVGTMSFKMIAAAVVLTFVVAMVTASVLIVTMPRAKAEVGIASFYSQPQPTASGERFNPMAMTCAHKRHAFGTKLLITDLSSGRSTTCRVTDRGPFIYGRVVDLSVAGARALGITHRGLARVRIEVVQ